LQKIGLKKLKKLEKIQILIVVKLKDNQTALERIYQQVNKMNSLNSKWFKKKKNLDK
jgi:hypothetical protein